jgi:hypothetical protein
VGLPCYVQMNCLFIVHFQLDFRLVLLRLRCAYGIQTKYSLSQYSSTRVIDNHGNLFRSTLRDNFENISACVKAIV